jgi:predicted metal-dependent peptidase
MKKTKLKQDDRQDVATRQFEAGHEIIKKHPLFSSVLRETVVTRKNANEKYTKNGLTVVTSDGCILCSPKHRAEPEKWAHAFAHCLLHLALEHFVPHGCPDEWNMACDCVAEKFLEDLKIGEAQRSRTLPPGISDEERLYRLLCDASDKEKARYAGFGTGGENEPDMIFEEHRAGYYRWNTKPDWPKFFASGLSEAVKEAVREAHSSLDTSAEQEKRGSRAADARQWFISNYPLLGAIAAHFRIVDDPLVCTRMQIGIAAVSPALSEIYINLTGHLSMDELRFVMAHEYLHAALRHDARREWRDAYLWNVACDFVINQWLTEMGVGERPDGALYDEQFKGMNAEAVYDIIVTDMRTYRKLATLRGVGLGDILPGVGRDAADVDLDEFYRRALMQGLDYHQEQNRGYLPAGLIEEIRALSHPPIPWDVELARWFDGYFTPIEKTRSYARPSRRQSSTPDIPRPNWVVRKEVLDGRTFGVVLDTSDSMERGLLAAALGAIASYSASRDVPAARVVFCDAQAYDMGYMKPEDIAGTVKVKGRGGTILQPGIDLLENAEDFPKDAPILIITDGLCDKVALHGREHAFLIPRGAHLPFVAKGKIFRIN